MIQAIEPIWEMKNHLHRNQFLQSNKKQSKSEKSFLEILNNVIDNRIK